MSVVNVFSEIQELGATWRSGVAKICTKVDLRSDGLYHFLRSYNVAGKLQSMEKDVP